MQEKVLEVRRRILGGTSGHAADDAQSDSLRWCETFRVTCTSHNRYLMIYFI